MESTKISEKNIRVLTSNGKEEVTFPNRFIQYCNRLNKIFTESYDVESGDESETSDENDVAEITTTRGSSKDVKSVEEFLTKYSCGDLVDIEFLKNLSKESMKGMLLVSEDFGIKILSTLLCTKFVDGKAALDNIYEFLDIDSKNLKDVERAAFKTAMTSGIKIPESCVDAWPLLSTTPSSIYSKWKELNEEERKEEQDTRRSNKFDGLAFQSETITLISSSGDEFVANSKLACELSAHLRHFVNLSDRDSDNEDSDPEEESTTSQRIKLSTSTSSVLRVFMDYANLYEKNGSPSEFSVSDWESAFLLKIGDEKLGEILNGIEFLGVKPLLLLLATRLAKKTLCEIYKILDKPSVEIGSLDEASYATCHMSGIPMDKKSISKWPVNFVRPVEVYWKVNGKRQQ